MYKLLFVFSLCVIASFCSGAKLELGTTSNGQFKASVDTKYTDKLDVTLANIYEVNRADYDREDNNIDFNVGNFQQELQNRGVQIYSQVNTFSSPAEGVYTYSNQPILGPGTYLTITADRNVGDDAIFATTTAQATEAGKFTARINGLPIEFELAKFDQKLDFFSEWPTQSGGEPNVLILALKIEWEADESSIAGSFISGGGDFTIETNEIKDEEGNTEGYEIILENASFKIIFPGSLNPKGYSATTGSPESPPESTELVDVYISHKFESGDVKENLEGSADIYLVLKADRDVNDNREPTVLPVRVEIDPIVTAESSAANLFSWVSLFL